MATLIDPGATAMLWHILGGAAVISLFRRRRIADWLERHAGLPEARSNGFMFAVFFACFSTPLTLSLSQGQPLPRFNDIFLAGIVLTSYLFDWQPATFLLLISVLVSAWILPPYGTFRVIGFSEWYRLVSFASVSILIVFLITRRKARRPVESLPAPAMRAHAAAGD
jgi:K+-sensing histidine kinase KdpD